MEESLLMVSTASPTAPSVCGNWMCVRKANLKELVEQV